MAEQVAEKERIYPEAGLITIDNFDYHGVPVVRWPLEVDNGKLRKGAQFFKRDYGGGEIRQVMVIRDYGDSEQTATEERVATIEEAAEFAQAAREQFMDEELVNEIEGYVFDRIYEVHQGLGVTAVYHSNREA